MYKHITLNSMTKTSRKQLISWFNSLKIPITKIEDLGTGAPICNLLNIIHPTYRLVYTQSPSSKYEYLKNLKVAQGFFFETGVKLKFDIEKLVECKLQDNLEVAQWLYKYYVRNVGIRSDGVKGGVSIESGCVKGGSDGKNNVGSDGRNVYNVGMIMNGRNVNCVGSDGKNNVGSDGVKGGVSIESGCNLGSDGRNDGIKM
ncbi:eb1 protein [Vairimorpha apis BRL 01]|uniref:Eb1 protein n=1 Tax=Vairimorpha apis BRL 01 TaxID=1037528 RepID=T0LDG9_9MICR|nr:eb1 protein [Vairimorpha apis BRL 01]